MPGCENVERGWAGRADGRGAAQRVRQGLWRGSDAGESARRRDDCAAGAETPAGARSGRGGVPPRGGAKGARLARGGPGLVIGGRIRKGFARRSWSTSSPSTHYCLFLAGLLALLPGATPQVNFYPTQIVVASAPFLATGT
jgi:hypothetical protein